MTNKISVGTITRTIILALALLNQVLLIAGINPLLISDDTITQLVSMAATVITAVAAWWKNNSFSKAALAGDVAKESEKAKVT